MKLTAKKSPKRRPPSKVNKILGADSVAFAACMLTVKVPFICARVAAAVSAQAARRNCTPQGIIA